MLKILLKFNPVLWLVLLVGLCYMDHQTWETDVYQPLLQEVESKKSELESAKADLARIDDFIKNRDAKQAELEKVREQFDQLKKEFPSSAALPSLMKSLADISERLGMEVAVFRPGNEMSVDLLKAVEIEVKLRGSYVQVMSFLDSVSNLERIVNTESLTLRPGNEAASNSFKTLEADLKIRTYFGGQ